MSTIPTWQAEPGAAACLAARIELRIRRNLWTDVTAVRQEPDSPEPGARSRAEEFEDLVDRHTRLMASAIRRVCGRRHRALIPDVEQELRLALWKRLGGGGKEIRHPASYLYKMALTTALAIVRKQPLVVSPGDEDVGMERFEEPASPELGLLPAERRRLLAELLDQLDRDEAEALRAYLAGFNHVEVAELFGWSESVARHRIYRSIERLKARAAELHGGTDERAASGR
jgi:RNA polymerase sigma factor (sigma-70 family)